MEELAGPEAAWALAVAWAQPAVTEQVQAWGAAPRQAAWGLIQHRRLRRMRKARADSQAQTLLTLYALWTPATRNPLSQLEDFRPEINSFS